MSLVLLVAALRLLVGAGPDDSVRTSASAQPTGNLVEVVSSSAEDVGELPVGTRASRSIRLRNRTTVSVELSIGRKSCGCLGVQIAPDVIGPGEIAELTFSVQIAPISGQQTHFVEYIATARGAPGVRQTGLAALTYTPEIPVLVQPRRLALRIPANAQVERRVFVLPAPQLALGAVTARCDLPCAWVADERAYLSDGAALRLQRRPGMVGVDTRDLGARVLTVTIHAAQPGVYRGTISLFAGDADGPFATVPVHVHVDEPLTADPPGIVATAADRGLREWRIRLATASGEPLVTDGVLILTDDQRVRAELETLPGRIDQADLIVKLDMDTLAETTRRFEVRLTRAGTALRTVPVVVYRPEQR